MHWINFRVRVLCLGIPVLWGCYSRDHEAEKTFSDWYGETIEIPVTLEPKILGRDTTLSIADVLDNDYCVLTFIDSAECSECNMKLHDWHLRMKEITGLADKVNFIFIVHAKNFAAVSAFAIKNKFNHLMFYDPERLLWKINKDLPQRTDLQTFLIDRKHKIRLIGNPIGNKTLWELYKKQIAIEPNDQTASRHSKLLDLHRITLTGGNTAGNRT